MTQDAPTYSIGEVAKRTGVKAHTLRYWESEFGDLQPAKDAMGNRVYCDADIALVRRIQYLLYEAKYTQEGARQVLAGRLNGASAAGYDEASEDLADDDQAVRPADLWALRGFLVKLLQELDDPA